MTNMKSTKRALISSVLAMFLCFAMLLGTTYAWFTDEVSSANNIIQTGTLDIEMYYSNNGTDYVNVEDEGVAPAFNYKHWEPGYTEVKYVKIVNNGSLAFKFKLDIVPNVQPKAGEPNLAEVIDVYMFDANAEVTRETIAAATPVGTLADLMAEADGAAHGVLLPAEGVGSTDVNADDAPRGEIVYCIVLKMKEFADNNYQNLSVGEGFSLQLMATQYTWENDAFDHKYDEDSEYPVLVDKWDGTVDTTWYNDTDTEFTLTTAEQLAGLAELVDGGNTFEGKTIKLACGMDLYCTDENGNLICFDPIGSYGHEMAFKGTFDGQNKTVYNLSQNTWALDNGYSYSDLGLGLFGMVENATIKNLTMDGADLSGESAIVGIVASCAYGDMTFENITVKNSKGADYQYYAGGVVGWASGNHKYINCDVDASTTIAAQWGDFDNSTGGVIGGCGGSATILFKDCDVACRIDAYNDVTSSYQWYAYRRCGMLIGNTGKTETVDGTTYAAAPQLVCENVTVTYGEWANYTYCEFAGTNWPYVRVQAGISNSAYSNPRYGHPTDANGNEVVDDSHVHNDGEDHQILCVFNQLYGGGQGVYGDPTHNGVTVIYNNNNK